MMICGAGGRDVCGAILSCAGRDANQVSSSTLEVARSCVNLVIIGARQAGVRIRETYLSSEIRFNRTGDWRFTRRAYTVDMMRSSMTARRTVK